MISIANMTQTTDEGFVVSCLSGLSGSGSHSVVSVVPAGVGSGFGVVGGLGGGRRSGLLERVLLGADERPTTAPAAAAPVQAQAYARAFAANGAGVSQKRQNPKQDSTKQKNPIHTMWAHRGLEPWRDPA